jgi:hypothetical protein
MFVIHGFQRWWALRQLKKLERVMIKYDLKLVSGDRGLVVVDKNGKRYDLFYNDQGQLLAQESVD